MKPSGKTVVAYRSSAEPTSYRPAAKQQAKGHAAAGSAKPVSNDGKPHGKSRKLTVAIATPPSARTGSAAAAKARDTSAASASRTNASKNARIITAKAEVAKPKTRR